MMLSRVFRKIYVGVDDIDSVAETFRYYQIYTCIFPAILSGYVHIFHNDPVPFLGNKYVFAFELTEKPPQFTQEVFVPDNHDILFI